MKNEDLKQLPASLQSALRAMREECSDVNDSTAAEARMVAAFRAHHLPDPVPVKRWVRWTYVAALAAGLIVAVAAVRLLAPPRVGVPEAIPVVSAPVLKSKPEPPVRHAVARSASPKPLKRKASQRRLASLATSPKPPVSTEVATDFFPIPYAPPMTPQDRGQIVRVSMPAASVRSVGLPLIEERWPARVQADVVLGEDGIARAIRLVRPR